MLNLMVKLPGLSELGRSLNNCPRRLPLGCTSAREFRVILLCPTVLFAHNAGVEGSSPSLSTANSGSYAPPAEPAAQLRQQRYLGIGGFVVLLRARVLIDPTMQERTTL